jgi:starch phosphorylase
MPQAGSSSRFPNLPDSLRGLERLAYNLWWSWNRPAREMFRSLEVQAWVSSNHNPILLLSTLYHRMFLRRL